MQVIGRYSNPPRTPADLGKLVHTSTADGENESLQDAHGPRYRRLSRGQIEQLLEDYASGTALSELADKYNISDTTVKAHLDRAGVPRPIRPGKLSAVQIQDAADRYTSGHPVTHIATELGVGEETLRRALRRAGIHLRSPT